MDRHITTPITAEVTKNLKAGDYVYITGTIYVARDAAHKRMIEALERGEELPIDIKDSTIYYMGPSPAREGRPIGSAGPTTASRMDKYAPTLLDLGEKAMIGKGKRTKEVMEAIIRNQAVYFAAIGGAGALLSKCITKSEIVCYEDLGAEAIRKLEVKDFPVIVVIDSEGNNLYETAIKEFSNNLNWAVLGCGVIANEMAQALEKMGKCLYAVGNRTHEKAVTFAEKYQVPKVYDDFHEMFYDPQVDVIYITTPHNTHIEFVREALQNGKHVLCEKSITLNSLELEEAVKLAKENNLVFAEAMTIWHMPLYRKLWDFIRLGETGEFDMDSISEQDAAYSIIKEGIPAFGKVQVLQMNFGSYKDYNMKNRFFNMDLAGGALLDIGVYALSITRSFMTSQPDQILSQVKYAATGADEQAGILLMNPDGQMATLTLSLHSKQPKRAVISCEKGYIEIMDYPRAEKAIIVEAETGTIHQVAAGATENALQYEMMDMEDAILNGNTSIMRLNDTIDVMEIMTYLRKEWGMKYPEEIW